MIKNHGGVFGRNPTFNNITAEGTITGTVSGLAIGTDVQAHDAALDDIAGLAVTDGNVIVGDGTNWVAESGATARTSLGLGSIATQAADSVDIDGGAIDGAAIGANSESTGKFSTLEATGAVVFNEAGGDFDFRVEGDDQANLLFCDASADTVKIGTTSNTPGYFNTITGTALTDAGRIISASTSGWLVSNTGVSGGTLIGFGTGTNWNTGTISTTTTTVTYGSASDYRLKDDVQPMTGSITRLKALNPVNFRWTRDGSRIDGFIAHEAQQVVPESVTGQKDEVDEDGNPIYQNIDQAKLVPLLTDALQEAIAKIETLEAKVAALEGAS